MIFRTLVVKLNLKTPGREDDENVKLYSKAEYRQKVAQPQSVTDDIIRGLGGKENILSVIYGVKVGQVRSRVDNWLAEN